MPKYIYSVDDRNRPVSVTPEKGSDGDLCNESMVGFTDLDYIIKRYGGNLDEVRRWSGQFRYGDDISANFDLQEAFEKIKAASDALIDTPFRSLDEAIKAINDGTFESAITPPKADEAAKAENNEKTESKPQGEQANL